MKVLQLENLKAFSETPLADVLVSALRSELDQTYEERASLLIPGQAIETQEKRVFLLGIERVLQDIIDILEVKEESGVFEEYFQSNDILIADKEIEWKTPAESTLAETEY